LSGYKSLIGGGKKHGKAYEILEGGRRNLDGRMGFVSSFDCDRMHCDDEGRRNRLARDFHKYQYGITLVKRRKLSVLT